MAWFAALCDDDYEFLGVPDPRLASSWEHCRGIALAAEEAGYDNLLLPSGYAMGIDSVAFAAGIAPLLKRMQLLTYGVQLRRLWRVHAAAQPDLGRRHVKVEAGSLVARQSAPREAGMVLNVDGRRLEPLRRRNSELSKCF